MRRLSRAILITSAFLPTVALAQKRAITDKDLFAFNWIGDTQLSPDGHTLVFVQASVTPTHDGYQTTLYTLDLTTPNALPQLLTPGTHDASPRFSPDGKQLAFLRAAEKDGKPTPPQLYLTTLAPDASPIKLTDLTKGASAPQWSPDGLALTVESATPQDQAQAKLDAAKKARATGDNAHVSDVKIINRAIWASNGEGIVDPTLVPQLYMVYLPKPDGTQDPAWQLTTGRFGIGEYLWSPKSDWIFFSSNHEDEPVYATLPHNSIYAIKAPTSSTHPKDAPAVEFTDDLKVDAHGISLSPDAHHLAFHASDEPKPISHQQTDLFTVEIDWHSGKPAVAKSGPRNLIGTQAYEMGSGVGGDQNAPRGGGRGGLTWSSDGSHLLDIVGSQGSAILVSVDTKSGRIEELTAPKQAVQAFVSSSDQSKLIALISNPIQIGDLYSITPNKMQTQLTHVNEALFSKLSLTMPLDIQVAPTVHAVDIQNHPIDTFVQLPPDYKTGTRLPLILNIHGGPHSAYGWVFDHEMQYMAAKGYVVVYPNPRGSTTYGQQFANVIMNNYPGDDFHDLMDTVDAVVAQGYADPARLGVTGGSGGGLLTDWVVTQTDRFKAAVAQRDIVDWADWWYTADAAGFHQSFYPQSPPFDHIELYRAHSPITFVNNIKTPMMFILGDADYRTPPPAGGEQFFRALKYKCIPTVMVRFPRESHELSRSGEPWHRVERLENIVSWFDKFLLNHPEPQYDLPEPCTKP